MRINTNVASLTAQENAANVNKNLSSSLEKLSSGLRINKAADDASGMAIADKLRTQASSLGQSISNANSAGALVQIADKAMAEQSNILDIVKTKLIQAATETTSDEGRESIRKDVEKLLGQLDNIASQTNYNGINLLNTSGKQFTFQVGEDKDYDITMTTAYAANTSGLGGGAEELAAAGAAYTIADGDQIAVKGETSGITFTATAATDTIDASGDLGELTADGALTLTANDEATKTLLTSIAAASGSDLTDAGNGTFTLADTKTVDLSGYNVNVGIKMTTAGDTLAMDGTGLIQIKETGSTATGTVKATTSEALVGGDLLSGLTSLGVNGLDSTVANKYMTAIDSALNQINTLRSDFGSTQNQLDSFVRNAMTTQTNIKAAESVIRDVDYAQESANFNKQNIIAQAGTYAMSQANAVQQNVMRLLQ